MILLDTNIFFSALISDGNERLLVTRCLATGMTIAITDQIVDEIERTIQKKMKRSYATQALDVFEKIKKHSAVYIKSKQLYAQHLPHSLTLINKKDAGILAAGLQDEMEALITGDKDFIDNKKLTSLRRVKIFTTKEFFQRFFKE